MGSARLGLLSRQMLEAGWDPRTPAAVIMAATTPRQRQVTGSLADIAECAAETGLGPPSILVVGEVVSLSAPLMGGLLAGAGVAE
jgi:uroporphyrin-III C-methyltransferase